MVGGLCDDPGVFDRVPRLLTGFGPSQREMVGLEVTLERGEDLVELALDMPALVFGQEWIAQVGEDVREDVLGA